MIMIMTLPDDIDMIGCNSQRMGRAGLVMDAGSDGRLGRCLKHKKTRMGDEESGERQAGE